MRVFEIASWLLIVTAAFSYANHRYLRAPRAIGLLLGGLFSALTISAFDRLVPGVVDARQLVGGFNFSAFLLTGTIGFLVFAGALDIDVEELRSRRTAVLVLATVGVVVSTLIVGAGTYAILNAAGSRVPLVACFLFGALISPTDPVAVLAIMRELSVRKRLQVAIAGESLFNDGVAIVLYSVIASIAVSPSHDAAIVVRESVIVFAREGLGGLAMGGVLALLAYFVLKTIDAPNIEVLISVALVAAIALASLYLRVSAPLGCAVAGLVIGHQAREKAMKEPTRIALDTLWSFVDSVLNALLFFVLGVEALSIGLPPLGSAWSIALIVILVVAARFASVWAGKFFLFNQDIPLRTIVAVSWGGLRGAVSLALALMMPPIPGRGLLLEATYVTVIFSLVVQGLTVAPLLRKLRLREQDEL